MSQHVHLKAKNISEKKTFISHKSANLGSSPALINSTFNPVRTLDLSTFGQSKYVKTTILSTIPEKLFSRPGSSAACSRNTSMFTQVCFCLSADVYVFPGEFRVCSADVRVFQAKFAGFCHKSIGHFTQSLLKLFEVVAHPCTMFWKPTRPTHILKGRW